MVLICVIGILCIFALWGMRKGVIRIAVSLAAMIITIAVTTFASPIISESIRKNTNIDDKIARSLYEMVAKDGKSYGSDDASIIESNSSVYMDAIQQKVEAIGEYMNLPESLTSNIAETTANKLLSGISTSGATIKEIGAQIFAEQMAVIIINAVSYCVVFVVLYIVLKVLTSVTGVISRLPVIHQADKLCGMAAGIIEGLIIVWLFFAVITAFGSSEGAVNILAQIHGNRFLEFIYDNNLIMKIIIAG